MGKIRRMDPHLANMIAAGEVVERPANIVKELLENAIDAGANRIDIELNESGMQSIRVSDNGSGMAEDDMLLAFERHATSKIQTEYDLFHIASLGFRGEALPSIAAVATVEIVSCLEGSEGRILVLQRAKGSEVWNLGRQKRNIDLGFKAVLQYARSSQIFEIAANRIIDHFRMGR
ncbi:MAG: DNA mismatch repair endonuclease MutL [Bacillus subtilis]|nr:DNA mismatch repair endonuclease MutL [Bacillus subtilis]